MAWYHPASHNRTVSKQQAVSRPSFKISTLLVGACLATSLGGCAQIPSATTMKNDVFDYLNLRNSFLSPNEVGRFDKGNPFGQVRPITWPILEQLDVVDETNDKWQTATDPVPSDLVVENREYVVGPGDTLRVTVFELVTPGLDYTKELQVNDVGAITLQNLGSVQVNGLTPSQVEAKVGQVALEQHILLPRSDKNFGPQVSVQLMQSRARVFSILGVQRAGTYNIIGNDFKLLDALALAGDLQPQLGLEYLYIIRSAANPGKYSDTPLPTADTGVPNTPVTPVTPVGPNPLDTIDTIEKPATAPDVTPQTPATGPGAAAPTLMRPLPTAVVLSNDSTPSQLAQADLDSAISGSQPSTTTPAVSAATPATAAPAATTTASGDDLLNQAMSAPTTANSGQYAFVDGKWVAMGSTTTSAPATIPGTPPNLVSPIASTTPASDMTSPHGPANEKALEDAEKNSGQRVIRIPIAALREGHPQYNVVIRPGDTIVVPTVEQGFFYMAGHVAHPGVYALSGQKITLKMAVAAAGNLDALAIPRRCELVRRIGPNEEATVQVNLQAIFDAEQPDIFLKANDMVNIGTDMVAPFLAVTRNAYRLSYGWGFVYDKNFAETSAQQSQGSGL